jgi:hypothetical protein
MHCTAHSCKFHIFFLFLFPNLEKCHYSDHRPIQVRHTRSDRSPDDPHHGYTRRPYAITLSTPIYLRGPTIYHLATLCKHAPAAKSEQQRRPQWGTKVIAYPWLHLLFVKQMLRYDYETRSSIEGHCSISRVLQ